MKINMTEWLKDAPSQHKAMPVLSFPGMQLTGTAIDRLVVSGELQADCMKAVADRYPLLASLSLMDLSVEAEAFGSALRFSGDEVPTVTGAIVKCEEDANNLKIPSVGTARTGEYVKAIEYAVQKITDIPVLAGCIGPFSLAGRMLDMTEIMVSCYTDPDVVHTVLRKATGFLLGYIGAFKTAGANGVVVAEPAAGLLSPDLIAEFSSPYVRQIVEKFDGGDFLVIYHNCGGGTISLLDSILSIGARVLHFGNAIDMSEMLKLVPSDVVVMGNVDPTTQFRNGTPESVREATVELLEKCGGYPNFVISSGCDIPPVSPIANIDAFFDAVEEWYA